MQPRSNRHAHSNAGLLVAEYRSHSCTLIVDVHELTVDGCIIAHKGHIIRARARIQIKFPGLAFLSATVLWVFGERAGLEFEHPLYEPVLAHLLRTGSPGR